MDTVLQLIDKKTEYVGHRIEINWADDFPYYQCSKKKELKNVLEFLNKND